MELADVVGSSRDDNIEGANVPKNSLSCARYEKERLPTSVKESVVVGTVHDAESLSCGSPSLVYRGPVQSLPASLNVLVPEKHRFDCVALSRVPRRREWTGSILVA